MFKEYLKLTLKGVRHRPLRSWLTVLGIVIGIMLVVTILSLSTGIQYAITQQMQSLGGDLIYIYPGEETNPFASLVGGAKFRDEDLEDLEDIAGVEYVVPMDISTQNIDFDGRKETTMIIGSPWYGLSRMLEESQGLRLETGYWPQDDGAKEVVIGYLAARELFGKELNVGDQITIKSKRFTVAGTLSEVGNRQDDNQIYVSLEMLRVLTGVRSGVSTAVVKVSKDYNIDLVALQIEHQLAQQEVVSEFAVMTSAEMERMIGDVLSIVEIGLMVIAFISLVVGAVGVMNTMYTSVLERTRQIGVMKAIGASRDSILSLFLIESGLIGLIGGIFGTIFGVVAAFLLGLAAGALGVKGLFSFASLDYLGLLAILSVTFITGVIAGILPARQAASMEPAEALRYE